MPVCPGNASLRSNVLERPGERGHLRRGRQLRRAELDRVRRLCVRPNHMSELLHVRQRLRDWQSLYRWPMRSRRDAEHTRYGDTRARDSCKGGCQRRLWLPSRAEPS